MRRHKAHKYTIAPFRGLLDKGSDCFVERKCGVAQAVRADSVSAELAKRCGLPVTFHPTCRRKRRLGRFCLIARPLAGPPRDRPEVIHAERI
jgi:hypothetical protein